MIPLRLVPRNLLAHPIRSLLTAGSMMLAVFILCCLQSLIVAITAGVEDAASNRLVVQSAVSLYVYLPESYQAKIDNVPGVAESCKLNWFGGYFREERNFFAQFGTDPDRLLSTYPEMRLLEGSDVEAFRRDRRACLIGTGLAEKYGWRIGDLVPITGTIFQRAAGGAWEFEVAGIYEPMSDALDRNTMFFHWEYLNQALEVGDAMGPGGVSVYVLGVEPGVDLVQVMADVDDLFANGPQRVQTTTEKEFQRQFVSMLGSVPTLIGSIGGGVVFAIVLAVLNTMMMAGRERTRDFGIIKALGFQDRIAVILLVLESLFLCLLGGVLGVGLALLAEPVLADFLSLMFPGFAIRPTTIAQALVGSVVVAILAALVPAWRARRLRPVEAFRED